MYKSRRDSPAVVSQGDRTTYGERPASIRRGYADTEFGQIHYAEAGGPGRPVLLLHQTPRSSDEFRELMPLLAEDDRRVLAMDMPGFGMSAPLPAPQTLEQYAAGAVALLDTLDLDRVDLLGHHTGAMVAVELAASHPERVRRLVLSSASYTDAAWRAQRAQGHHGVDEVEHRVDGNHLLELWTKRAPYYPPARADLLDRFIHDALAPGVDPAEGHRAVARYEMERVIDKVVASTLLLGAADDPFARAGIEPLRDALANASVQTHIIEGGTIPLMEHKAAEVALVVGQFLSDW